MATGKKFLLLHQVLEARTRLREALRSIEYDASIDIARTFHEGKYRLTENADFTTVFLSYLGTTEPLEEILEASKSLGEKKPHFIVVLPNPQVDATHVAELFARGVDGFIAEPYSSVELADLFEAINESAQCGEAAQTTRDMRMLGFLTSRLQLKLDEVADIQALRESVISKLPRTFSPLKDALSRLFETDREKFEKTILTRYENVPPPKSTRRKIRRKPVEEVTHPGVRIGHLIKERQIETAKITTLLGLDEANLSQLLEGELSVDEQLATKLARALGETPRYWLEMQRAFNSTKTTKETPGSAD